MAAGGMVTAENQALSEEQGDLFCGLRHEGVGPCLIVVLKLETIIKVNSGLSS